MVIGLAVGALYLLAQVGVLVYELVSFPGYTEYDKWIDELGNHLSFYSAVAYSLLTITSTLLTIHSIRQIFTTTKNLSASNDNLSTNQGTLVLHSVLMALNCFVAIFYGMPYNWARKITY
jgi:hypothetical protein